MKLRVIKAKNGKFKPEYYCEHRNIGWSGTYRNLNSVTQNEFSTLEEAV